MTLSFNAFIDLVCAKSNELLAFEPNGVSEEFYTFLQPSSHNIKVTFLYFPCAAFMN
jgi:hypothetical protein